MRVLCDEPIICGLIMRPSIIMPKLTPQSRRRNASGNSKCPSNFIIAARIQADFNTFYRHMPMHGSMNKTQANRWYFGKSGQQIFCYCLLLFFWQALELFGLLCPTLPTSENLSTNRLLPFASFGNSINKMQLSLA